MTDRELLEQALSWIEAQPVPRMLGGQRIIEAIRTRLAEPEEAAEPVACYLCEHKDIEKPSIEWDFGLLGYWTRRGYEVTPLYRHPPPRPAVRLSDKQLIDIVDGLFYGGRWLDIARAIEAAVLKKNNLGE